MLPKPAPEVVMDATGTYWRRFDDGTLSIPPSSDTNDPAIGPLAVYRLVGFEQADGTLELTAEAADLLRMVRTADSPLNDQRYGRNFTEAIAAIRELPADQRSAVSNRSPTPSEETGEPKWEATFLKPECKWGVAKVRGSEVIARRVAGSREAAEALEATLNTPSEEAGS